MGVRFRVSTWGHIDRKKGHATDTSFHILHLRGMPEEPMHIYGILIHYIALLLAFQQLHRFHILISACKLFICI